MEKLLVTIDSVEDGKAALLLRCPEEERPLGIVPVSMLPEGVAVGDILSLSVQAEPELTEAARRRVDELHGKLLWR